MAWSVPTTAVAGSTVLTSSIWNSSVRDNLLETGAAKVSGARQTISGAGSNQVAARQVAQASVATSQNTSSTSYTDLATPGPSVTVTTGTRCLIILSATMATNAANAYANATWTVSGATSTTSGWAIISYRSAVANDQIRMSGIDYPGSINAGTNTFKMVYSASGGTATFVYRNIIVWPI
jgi:hypothetical protein